MKKLHLFFLIILALGLVGWFFVWPSIGNTLSVRDEMKMWESRLDEANQTKQRLEELKNKYELMKDEKTRILETVPKSEDLPGLITQLDALTSQNGLILNSAKFVLPKESNNVAAAENSAASSGSGTLGANLAQTPVETLGVTLDLGGNYSALKGFLKAVENNLRLSDVTSIDFGSDSGQSGSELKKISVGLNIYYKR